MLQKYSVVISNLPRLVFSLLNYQTRERKPSLRTEYCGSVECGLDYNAEWEIPRENLLLGDVLGEGAFGIVRKGVLQEGDAWRDVAVKMLRGKCVIHSYYLIEGESRFVLSHKQITKYHLLAGESGQRHRRLT